ncbi:MAG: DUF2012 domain-containing protein [Verrucomicrobia bacterium]|nr:DUF2012 domain-containing protein [Verrucomicrobiota bacterium]MBI3869334.1 DUF2012 domain-containing protein [Verrucomicrobiota bacterium]
MKTTHLFSFVRNLLIPLQPPSLAATFPRSRAPRAQAASAGLSCALVVGLCLGLLPARRSDAFVGVGVGATLLADYQFQNTLTSSLGSAPPLGNLGPNSFGVSSVDGVSRTVLNFNRNDGLSLSPASSVLHSGAYSVVILFEFQEIPGWRRILDFKNATSDTGLYSLNGALNFYNVALGPSSPIGAGGFVQVVLTRDFAQNVVGYVNGEQQFSFVDSSQFATLDGSDLLRLFRDEDPVYANEASAGSIARLRVYDGALTASQVAALDRLPGISFSTVQFVNSVESRTEDAGFVSLSVARSGNTQGPASVEWFVSGGTATPDSDYSGAGGTITFASGQTSATLNLFIIDDTLVEPDETIQISLRNPVGATLGSPGATTLTLLDNDIIVTPIPRADLELTMSASANDIEVGDNLAITLMLFNRGPDPATNIVVHDALPLELGFASASADSPSFFDPFTLNWSVPFLAPGEIVMVRLNTLALAPGSLAATAEVIESPVPDADSFPGNEDPAEDDMATVFVSVLLPPTADLRLTKAALPDTVGVEQSLPFYIRVENLGPNDSKDIVIKDTLPASMTFKQANPPDGTTFDKTKMEWRIPRLDAGRFFELELLVTSAVPVKAKNLAEITATGVRDPDRSNNRAEAEGQWILYMACGTVKLCGFNNGDPHTNAIVELSQNGKKIAETRSDAQGAFCFKDLPAGKYKVIAKPADPASGIKNSEEDEIAFGDGMAGGAVQLASPWPVIRGRIRYPSGGPGVADIEVKLAGKDVNKTSKTDKDGGYLFPDLVDGDYTVTPVAPAGGGSFNPKAAAVKFQFCVASTNFAYYGDRSIIGRVVTCDKPAKPVLYPTVTLALDGGDVLYTRASADGSFGFTNLVPGKYTLTASHPAYTFAAVNVETKNKSTQASIVGSPRAKLIGARIVDTHGAPIAGVDIGIFPPGANRVTATQTTDANGAVLFQNVATGTWVVQPQIPDRRFVFTPGTDVVAVGDPKLCRNHAVFVANLSAVEVVALEVVQVVQDWRNTMPLIEGKQTLVRAFFKPAGTARAPVTLRDVRLKITPAGQQSTTVNAGRSVVARIDIGEDKVRNHPQSSASFDITRFAKGDVTLTLEWPSGVLTTSPAAIAAGAVNNNSASVKFVAAPAFGIKWLLLDWKFENKKDAAAAAAIPKHRERVLAGFPVTVLRAGPKDQAVVKWEPTYDPSKDDPDVVVANTLGLHDLIADKYTRDEPKDSKVIYYTLVKGIPLRDNAAIPGNYILIRSDISAALYRNRPMHELGHSLGRHHAVHSAYGVSFDDTGPTKIGPCDEKANQLAPDFPMDFLLQQQLQPTLGPMRLGDYRFAYGWDHSDASYISPFSTADLMSYCTFGTQWTWPGLYTYTNLHNAIINRFGAGRAPAPQDPAGPCVIISGYITASGEATLDPVSESLGPRDPELPPPGEYLLRVLAPDGSERFAGPFGPEFVVEAEDGAILAPKSRYRFCLTGLGPIGAIEIRRAGALLLRREATAHAPQVQILAPAPGATVDAPEVGLRWTASDADGDALLFTVDVSVDGGVSWSTFAQNLSGTEATLPAANLPGAADIRLRVSASDGIHRSADESSVRLPDHPPTLLILSPESDAVVTGDAPLTLRADAIDAEDGELGGGVRWASDLDGPLGEGPELTVDASALTDGTHQISAQVVDSAGHVVTQTARVEVRHTRGPRASIRVDGDLLEISWPADAEGWRLEGTLSLEDPYWFPVSLETELEGDQFVYRQFLSDEALFLRLGEP